jgi:hypothetical protein
LWLNGRPFEWILILPGAPACTTIALSPDKPVLDFYERATVRWSFAPAGCDFSAIRAHDVEFSVSSDLELFGYARRPSDFEPIQVTPITVGEGRIDAAFGSLRGSTRVATKPYPPCTGVAIDVGKTLLVGAAMEVPLPTLGRGGVAGRGFVPAGCRIDYQREDLVLDRPDRASLKGSRITGIAPGPVRLIYRFGTMTASAEVMVVAQPPCDRVHFTYPELVETDTAVAVGAVVGAPYHDAPTLAYERSDAPEGQRSSCVKPPGKPVFQSVTRAATVDAATGVATAVQAGKARIAVVHGDLLDITEFQVAATATCTGMSADWQVIPEIAVGGTARIHVSYTPGSCARPPGLVTFASSTAGVATVSRDGLVTGVAPGKATFQVGHGGLSTTTVRIEMVAPTPCTSMTARFDPPKVSPGVLTRVILDYAPAGCGRPDDDIGLVRSPGLEFAGPEGGIDLGDDEGEFTAPPGTMMDPVYVNPAGADLVFRPKWPGDFRVESAHGTLSAKAQLTVSPGATCEIRGVRLEPSRIKYDETARVIFDSEPAGCSPGSPSFAVADTSILRIERVSGGGYAVRGLRGGRSSVWIMEAGEEAIQSNKLTVEAPPCRSLELVYDPPLVKRNDYAFPDLTYAPTGCLRPPGRPVFTSDAPASIQPISALPQGDARRDDDLHPGILVARPGTANNPGGAATITVTHGALTAHAQVSVSD